MAVTNSSRTQQLTNLADAIPRRDQKRIQAGRDAATMAIRTAAAGADISGGKGTEVSQRLGAEATTAMAQPELSVAQQNLQRQGQLAQRQLQDKQATERKKEMQRRITKMRKQTEFQDLLARIDNEAKNKFLDAEMQFQQDSFGRTKFTEQQLMDYAALVAKDEVALQKYSDDVRRATENEMYMLKQANKVIMREMQHQLELAHTKRDHAYLAELKRRQHAIKDKLRKKQAARANRAMIAGAIFGTIGGVVGGYFGGPTGATAGASAGMGVGTAGAAAMES